MSRAIPGTEERTEDGEGHPGQQAGGEHPGNKQMGSAEMVGQIDDDYSTTLTNWTDSLLSF